MSIQQEISALLFENNCVIIPNMGGIITNHQPSVIDNKTGIITPPSKKIMFNKNLIVNDGLLAGKISSNRGVSYEHACLIIEEFVNDCFNLFKDKKRVVIEDVGVFYFDFENNLQFKESSSKNYLKNSFGLEAILLQELFVEDIESNIQSDKVEKPTRSISADNNIPSVAPNQDSTKTKRKRNRFFIGIPVLLLGGFFLAGGVYKARNPHYSLASVFSFPTKNKQIEYKYSERNNLLVKNSFEINSDNTLSLEGRDFVVIDNANNEKEKVQVVDENIPQEILLTKSTFEGKKYHVVTGCFNKEKNATYLNGKLIKYGFERASILSEKYKGMYAVIANTFDSRSEANSYRQELRDKGFKSWILKKVY